VYGAHGNFESVVAGPESFGDVAQEFPGADPEDCSVGGLDGVIDSAGRVYVLDTVMGEIQVMQRKETA
jgi:hypothetical protein